ncbi:hypothetical protein [Deinococcus aluminii]|uniref:Uncharacterized protein n=1 Tax=Deinococcus aluminii TaxID=1656885 RepID=A0ABP9XJJ4_9DEIO
MDDFIFDECWAFSDVPEFVFDDCVDVLADSLYEDKPDTCIYEEADGLADELLPTSTTVEGRVAAQQGLRDAGLFREGELEAQAMLRQWEANGGTFPPLDLPTTAPTTELAELYPHYALALAHGARIRMEGRLPRPLIGELKLMRQHHGRLVFIRFLHPELDEFSMIEAEGRRSVVLGSKTAIYKWLGRHAKRVGALVCVLHRDEHGRVHSHFVLPLAVLSKRLQTEIWQAPHGKRGGLCPSPEIHACLIGDTDDDLEGVGCYMSKYHDERNKLHHDHPDWLALAEEVAENMQYGEGEKVNLIWRLPSRWRPGHKPA